MSTTTKKISLFVQATISRMKGDTDEAMALDNQRKAISICNSEISKLESKTFRAEELVREAEKAVEVAKFPTSPINAESNDYLKGIDSAQKSLEEAKDNLENILYSIKRNKELLEEFSK